MTVRRVSASLILITAAVVIALANRAMGMAVQDFVLAKVSVPALYIADHVAPVRSTVQSFVKWHRLAADNRSLAERNEKLVLLAAQADQAVQENDFLRRVARISGIRERYSVSAGIFNIQLGPGGFTAMLNKGSDELVAAGDSVVSGDAELVGVVSDIFPKTALVRLVNDEGIEIAARVLGGSTRGIAGGQGPDGLSFELIAQGEDIQEGDSIVTAGTDTFPAGLIVGMVTHVIKNDSGIFQTVSIRPAADPTIENDVIVIRR